MADQLHRRGKSLPEHLFDSVEHRGGCDWLAADLARRSALVTQFLTAGSPFVAIEPVTDGNRPIFPLRTCVDALGTGDTDSMVERDMDSTVVDDREESLCRTDPATHLTCGADRMVDCDQPDIGGFEIDRD